MNRRQFLLGGAALGSTALAASVNEDRPALIGISLDLEMSRNFPRWEDTHWDYEKGNLSDAAKRYTIEACRRVQAAGGVLHLFALGRTFEQDSTQWLKDLVVAGHPVGNHTYDHVNVLAQKSEELQFRFQRAPWLIEGQTPAQVIEQNIAMTNRAFKTRLGIEPTGFRTPGGFADGLTGRDDLQKMLLKLGFRWVSAKYARHAMSEPGNAPGDAVFTSIVQAQAASQPFRYPSGLIEVPMSPVSDINAFRTGRWALDDFLRALRLAIDWTIEQRACFDFLGHPSCLHVVDPEFRAIDLLIERVRKAGSRARIVALDQLAARART